jgi:hypothetical protein
LTRLLASALLVNLTTMSDKVHKDLLFLSVAGIQHSIITNTQFENPLPWPC